MADFVSQNCADGNSTLIFKYMLISLRTEVRGDFNIHGTKIF